MDGKKRLYGRCSAFVIIAVWVCGSCNQTIVYNEYQPIKNKIWEQSAEYSFVFDIKDNTMPYNVSLQIRHNDHYPYQNLWILYELSHDSIVWKDTIECMLADDFGKWKGKGLTLFQCQFNLRENYHFPDTGRYTVSIRHGMREEGLKGVEDVGIVVESGRSPRGSR